MLGYILGISNLVFLLLGYYIGNKKYNETISSTVEKIEDIKIKIEGDNEDNVYVPPSDYKEDK